MQATQANKLGRKPSMNQEQIIQAFEILKSRDSWTWGEAEQAISDSGILVPAMKIYDMFRALGFKKTARNSPTWVKA
jgi:transposase